MVKIFLISAVVAVLGLGVGLPLDIGVLKGIGAIAVIIATLTGLGLLVMWIMRKAAG